MFVLTCPDAEDNLFILNNKNSSKDLTTEIQIYGTLFQNFCVLSLAADWTIVTVNQ